MTEKRICSIEGCGKPLLARGWCSYHYEQWRYYGNPVGKKVKGLKNEICSIENCDGAVKCRGWCTLHYSRWLRKGDPLAVPSPNRPRGQCPSDCECKRHTSGSELRKKPRTSIRCEHCGEDFLVIPSRVRIARFCSAFCRDKYSRAKRLATGKVYPTVDMSIEEFKAKLIAQNGCCAICAKEISGRDVHRDHCHGTNEWRGLLCSNCNLGLGLFRDDPALLMKAAEYVVTGGVVVAKTGAELK